MYYNGKKNGISVHQFMNNVHNAMKLKYTQSNPIVSADINQALSLQNFFQDIKRVSQGGIANTFDQAIIQEIIDGMKQSSLVSSNLKYIFGESTSGRAGGLAFERQLGAIIESVYNSIAEDDFEFDIKQVMLGSSTGTTISMEELDLSDEKIQKFLEKIGTKTQRNIETENGNSQLKEYYLANVSGKIDVKGYTIQIRGNANPKMIEIYNLLKEATFSAKSYDSMTFDQKQKMLVQASGRTALALGKTNILRSIYGALQEYSPDPKTTASAIFAGYNAIAKGDTDVANHFYHLRYMYELMGTGFKYNGESYGNVRFLIFNDPHGDIYVKSTSELFSEIIDEVLDGRQSWSSSIHISKEKFY